MLIICILKGPPVMQVRKLMTDHTTLWKEAEQDGIVAKTSLNRLMDFLRAAKGMKDVGKAPKKPSKPSTGRKRHAKEEEEGEDDEESSDEDDDDSEEEEEDGEEEEDDEEKEDVKEPEEKRRSGRSQAEGKSNKPVKDRDYVGGMSHELKQDALEHMRNHAPVKEVVLRAYVSGLAGFLGLRRRIANHHKPLATWAQVASFLRSLPKGSESVEDVCRAHHPRVVHCLRHLKRLWEQKGVQPVVS